MSTAAAAATGSRVGRIAVAQMRSTDVVEENFAAVRRLVQKAAIADCTMVSLPECFECECHCH
jgi:predicted amidohydrolase